MRLLTSARTDPLRMLLDRSLTNAVRDDRTLCYHRLTSYTYSDYFQHKQIKNATRV
jgi:hypothetical protein